MVILTHTEVCGPDQGRVILDANDCILFSSIFGVRPHWEENGFLSGPRIC